MQVQRLCEFGNTCLPAERVHFGSASLQGGDCAARLRAGTGTGPSSPGSGKILAAIRVRAVIDFLTVRLSHSMPAA